MRIFRFILWPIGILYGLGMFFRNKCYDWGVFSSQNIPIPVISVGNLSVGGTGKTPHVDFIAELLNKKLKSAILLRGYGRKTKGYRLVTEKDTNATVGDEALFYKLKHKKSIEVVVCENRVRGAIKICSDFPITKAILLDDAFQHRKIKRDIDILLIDFNRPYWRDSVLPAGRLREFSCGKKRAHIIIVTKAPASISEDVKNKIIKRIRPNENQQVFFSRIKYGEIIPFGNYKFQSPKHILLVTGIATPFPLVEYLKTFSDVKHLRFNDHHDFSVKDLQEIHNLFDTFALEDKIIVTTAKDFMRLLRPDLKKMTDQYPWFYQDITIEIDREKEFCTLIEKIC